MKQLQNQIVFFAIVLLFGLARSSPDWAETENGHKYLIESKYEVNIVVTIQNIKSKEILNQNLFPYFVQYTWFEALHECSKRNMSLVALDTAEKNFDMTKLLKNRFGKLRPQCSHFGRHNKCGRAFRPPEYKTSGNSGFR